MSKVKSVEYGLEKYLKAHKISSLLGTDYVEFYVETQNNPHIIIKPFRYQSLAYAGLETRWDRTSYLETR
jgi:hypothetical protein